MENVRVLTPEEIEKLMDSPEISKRQVLDKLRQCKVSGDINNIYVEVPLELIDTIIKYLNEENWNGWFFKSKWNRYVIGYG